MTSFLTICSAMMQLLVAVVLSAVLVRSVPGVSGTLRDFSFLISRLLVPCLIASHMILSINPKVLGESMVLVVFSIAGICMGVFGANVSNWLLFSPAASGGHQINTAGGIDAAEELHANGVQSIAVVAALHQPAPRKKTIQILRVTVDDQRCRLSNSELFTLLRPPSRKLEELVAYRCMSVIALSVQNTVMVPLSLLTAIATDIPWLELSVAVTYLFVYNLSVTIYFWGVGTYVVWEAAAEAQTLRGKRELMERIQKMVSLSVDAATQTLDETQVAQLLLWESSVRAAAHAADGAPIHTPHTRSATNSGSHPPTCSQASEIDINHSSSSIVAGARGAGMLLDNGGGGVARAGDDAPMPPVLDVARYRFDWQATRLVEVVRINSTATGATASSASAAAATAAGVSPVAAVSASLGQATQWALKARRTLAAFVNPPLLSSVAGLLIGIAPFKPALLAFGPTRMLLDAMLLIGTACVPASLLMLGANLSGLSGGATGVEVKLKNAASQVESLLEESADALFLSLVSAEPSFLLVLEPTPPPTSATKALAAGAPAPGAAVGGSGALLAAGGDRRDMHTSMAGGGAAVSPAMPDGAADARVEVSACEAVTATLASVAHATGLLGAVAFAASLLSIRGVVKARLVVSVILMRSIVMPGALFFLIHLCVRSQLVASIRDPYHNTLLLILFFEVAAPSAINTALLFSTRQFATKPFAKVLLHLYINALWSVVGWMYVALWYVS